MGWATRALSSRGLGSTAFSLILPSAARRRDCWVMVERPFRVLGVQQIAVGAVDKSPLHKLWVQLLGATPVGNYRSERENVDEDIAVLGAGLLRVELDLMQP